MAMKVKKYGIMGLLEWHGTLSFNGSKVKVSFTGGTTTHFGVAPASFSTSNSIIQYIIENSEQYKKGFIKLIRVYEVNDKKETLKPKPVLKVETPKPTAKVAEPTKEEVLKVEEPKAEVNEQGGEDTIGTFTEVEFTCVDDAKDFFSEKFGEARSAIRSRAQAEEAAKKHSFTIKWV